MTPRRAKIVGPHGLRQRGDVGAGVLQRGELATVRQRDCWIASIPGAVEVTIECLPGSTLPDELRKVGYDVTEIGEGKRILPTAIVEKFVPAPVASLSR
jgi:hypothetical protein